ncbi:Oidioi.mRNA.OKI2018_I69.XSR.g15679.t1.cds [Oikopleura dioica]|uniref:Oidioi.mRNA.OKI2018_I69.XSR.g15679.t1.cds n=1 Tax=Oikopleura dioica TaxID=34765 RepID=A0ABN7SHM6_OIKDI|nr:Oidioi.mRNA.OKI2018_I69.XSR.g15679.t1.cds [Oikopleura dioica]
MFYPSHQSLRQQLNEERKISKVTAENYKVSSVTYKNVRSELEERLREKQEFCDEVSLALDVKEKEIEQLQKKIKAKDGKISTLQSQTRIADSQRNAAQQFGKNIGKRQVLLAREMTRMVQRTLVICYYQNNSTTTRLVNTILRYLKMKSTEIPQDELPDQKKLFLDILNCFNIVVTTSDLRNHVARNCKYVDLLRELMDFIFNKEDKEEKLFYTDKDVRDVCCEILEQLCKCDRGVEILNQFNDGFLQHDIVVYSATEQCTDKQIASLLKVYLTMSTNEEFAENLAKSFQGHGL